MNFTEDFLHFIWQFRLFKTHELYCAGGEKLEILSPGILNKDAGPDFSHARLKIDHTLWAGNVELHIKSSDWVLHNHEENGAFESVILHVVYHHDQQIYRKNGSLIPVLVLKDLFSDQLLDTYHGLVNNRNAFPCEKQIGGVDQVVIEHVLSRAIAERLEYKSAEVLMRLGALKGSWDETFYYFMARNFGFKVNAVPFEMLASSLPQRIFAKHKNNPLQIEAMIFGQAGFLNADLQDEYSKRLFLEYTFLRKKYGFEPIDVSLWKFLRMRPQNFPTVRLAQFAALIISSSHLFSKILELKSLKEIYRLFEDLPVNQYWERHYHFRKTTKQVILQPGPASVQNIVINTICLFLFTYGKYTDQVHFMERAFIFLEELPAERNMITDQYVNSGVRPDSALMSQALLQLNKYHCNQKKCLNCGIGIKILKK
ncbi:DUF2851 family protein [Pedobacter frigoris]|uniref:DUF2851 family protein n=1 Tax=Pedobacter frigoris TaxID=2571272 RepID=UPI00292DFD0D|nr:DUF2851 family protein [Pedobacter frigoris]